MIKKLLLCGLALIAALYGCIAGGRPAQLRIITEDNPPFNFFDERGNITGQSTEIVRELIASAGIKADIQLLPWSLAYSLVQNESNTALYSTVRLPSRENLFRWVGPIGFDDYYFYTRRGGDPAVKSIDDARRVKSIAVYRDDAGHIFLKEKGFNNLDVNLSDVECIRSLARGTVDLWLGPALGMNFIAYEAGINPAELQAVCYVTRWDYYIAFNRDTDESLIHRMQSALDEMKKAPADGTMSRYEKIITSYALPKYSTTGGVTREQVISLVERTAIDLTHDAAGTINKINARSAPYQDSAVAELYVYVFDENVNAVANAGNPQVVGRSFKGVPDIAGKLFRDRIVEGALKNGSGWEDYVFTMPGKLGLFYKTAYYRLAAGSDGRKYIVCAGLYPAGAEK